jgi:hypothetical protein
MKTNSKLHKDLSDAREELAFINNRIQSARDTASKLPELEKQRVKLVGDAYLSGKDADVTDVDAQILSCQGATSALVVLIEKQAVAEKLVNSASDALDYVRSNKLTDKYNEGIDEYKAVIVADIRKVIINLTAIASLTPGAVGSSRSAFVQNLTNKVAELLELHPTSGWQGKGEAIYAYSIAKEVKEKQAEILSSLD